MLLAYNFQLWSLDFRELNVINICSYVYFLLKLAVEGLLSFLWTLWKRPQSDKVTEHNGNLISWMKRGQNLRKKTTHTKDFIISYSFITVNTKHSYLKKVTFPMNVNSYVIRKGVSFEPNRKSSPHFIFWIKGVNANTRRTKGKLEHRRDKQCLKAVFWRPGMILDLNSSCCRTKAAKKTTWGKKILSLLK